MCILKIYFLNLTAIQTTAFKNEALAKEQKVVKNEEERETSSRT